MDDTVTVTAGTTEPATVATIAPTERPSFAQAFASDAAAGTTTTQAPPDAATTQPAESLGPASAHTSAEQTGPIPFPVHKTALENARTKVRAEVEAEFKQKYGWADSVQPTEIQQLQAWANAYRADPIAWFAQTAAELRQQFPHLAQNLHSEAARVLAGARSQPAAPPEIEPDIPVVDDQGRVVSQAFSADRVKQLIARAVQDAIGKEVAPLRQTYERQQQEARAQQEQAALESNVKGLYEQAVSDLPLFKECEADIAKALVEIPGDSGTALYRAWAKVVLPKLEAQSQKKQLDELTTKAAASTVNPAGAVVAATKRPTSFLDAGLKW